MSNLSLTCLFFLVVLRTPIDVEGKIHPVITTMDHAGLITGFSNIQNAINSVPQNNKNWITINISPGVHREKITISANKGYIFLKGAGRDVTKIEWDDHNSTLSSATFDSSASNILAVEISFVNSYNYPPGSNMKNPVMPAVAALISGDKNAFINCSFLGYQDTLWDNKGRHYFKRCRIEGATDFIFGAAQSIYQECKMMLNLGTLQPTYTGFITANGRNDSQDDSAFVFKGGNIGGVGKAYLGRAWRFHARVLFYQTYIANIIDPRGWAVWYAKNYENQLTFAEEECTGPGSNKSGRVKWEASLNSTVLKKFINLSYINSDGWLQQLPIDVINH